jgi:hypothetical protein
MNAVIGYFKDRPLRWEYRFEYAAIDAPEMGSVYTRTFRTRRGMRIAAKSYRKAGYATWNYSRRLVQWEWEPCS